MADQLDIDELIVALREQTRALNALSGTPASRGDPLEKSTDRLVQAIARLGQQLDRRQRTEKEQEQEIRRFVQAVDRATDAVEDERKAIDSTVKAIEGLREATEAAADTTEAGAKKSNLTEEALTKLKERRERRYGAANEAYQKSAKRLFDEFGTGESVTSNLRDRFESLGGESFLATSRFKFVTAALDGFGQAALVYTKALYAGQQGAAVSTKAVQAFTNSIGTFMQVVGGILAFVPGFNLLGIGIAAAGSGLKTLGEVANESAELSDRLFMSYRDLAKAGVSAGDGLMGLSYDISALGQGLDQAGVEAFGSLMKNAAQDLAVFSGSVTQGRRDFIDFARGFARGEVGSQLQMMGYSVEEINEGLADYVGLQSRVGMSQRMTQEQLRVGAANYLKEMDGLAKLTGIQRKELEAGINRARAVEQFRAKVNAMRASGDERQIRAAAEMEKTFAVLEKQAPEMAQGFAEAASGLITSDAGRRFFMGIDSSAGVVQGLSSGAMSAEQALQGVYNAADQTTTNMNALGQAGAFSNVYGNFSQMSDLGARAGRNMEQISADIAETTRQQVEGADAATASQVELRQAQMNTRDELQDLIRAGIKPVTGSMEVLGTVVDSATKYLREMAGMEAPPGRTESGPGIFDRIVNFFRPAAGGAAGAAGGAAGASAPGRPAPGAAMPAPQATGAPQPKSAPTVAGGGPPTLGLNDYVTFTGGTGSQAHFEKLQPEVRQRFIDMARDYTAMFPGQTLQVNSAFRSPQEQASINPGRNPRAAPGRSLHQQGRALDIQSAQAAQLNQSGLLQKHGFKWGASFGDPPHIYMRDGGIADGPDSGYAATLHGAEAVVPLPDGRNIPVEIKQKSDTDLVTDMLQMLAKANRMYLETIPASRGGTALEAVNTSPEYMAEVMRMFERSAEMAVEANARGLDWVKEMQIQPKMSRDDIVGMLATGGITKGPSIAGEAGPEAVVPLPDGRTIPVNIENMADTDLTRRIADLQARFDMLNQFATGGSNLVEVATNVSDSYRQELSNMRTFIEEAKAEAQTRGINVEEQTTIRAERSQEQLMAELMGNGLGELATQVSELVRLQSTNNRTAEKLLRAQSS